MAVGGRRCEPGNTEAPCGFQPLSRLEEPGEHAWAADFVLSLFKCQGVPESPSLKEKIDHALDLLAGRDRSQRTLTMFSALLAAPEVAAALRPTRATVAGLVAVFAIAVAGGRHVPGSHDFAAFRSG